MRTAFKDWAVIVEALGAGKQILIFRKGGIREARGGFKVERDEFLLFPTLFHQQQDGLVDSAKGFYDGIKNSLHRPEVVPIEFACRVVDWRELENESHVLSFSGQHIWSDSVLKERFDWGRDKGIYVMALRVYRLPQRIELPLLPEYGGCKSWIDLARDFNLDSPQPVLGDTTFQHSLERFRNTLQQVEKSRSS